jgi:hypothetical protein
MTIVQSEGVCYEFFTRAQLASDLKVVPYDYLFVSLYFMTILDRKNCIESR